jgi:Flp pilus assembly protein TadD
MLLLKDGRAEEAGQEFREALRIKPDDAWAHDNLASALAFRGDLAGAIAHYGEAARLRPDWPRTLSGMARIRAAAPDPALRNGAEAVALAQRACELTGRKDPAILDSLAVAYAEVGRFAEAVATAREAAALARSQGKADLAARIEQRQRLFEAGQPFRLAPGPGPAASR